MKAYYINKYLNPYLRFLVSIIEFFLYDTDNQLSKKRDFSFRRNDIHSHFERSEKSQFYDINFVKFIKSMNYKVVSALFFLVFSGFVFGQTIPTAPQGIKANFSEQSIRVYQENSQNKLNEFYEYLSLYSTEKDENLKKQIRENLFLMVDNDFEIPDFTTDNQKEISLEKLLSKIENQNIQFKIKTGQTPTEVEINHWTNPYILRISQNGKTTEFKVEQTIYFEPKEKKFGSKLKTVWETKLGDLEIVNGF